MTSSQTPPPNPTSPQPAVATRAFSGATAGEHDDESDREWLRLVGPSDEQNSEPARRYHLVVLGAGPAGLVAAVGAAALGARVALVERHLLGGDCLNYGCVPSKALIRSARVAACVRNAHRFGVSVPSGWQADFSAVLRRVRGLRARLSQHDSAQRLRGLGVDVFFGDGRFVASDAVEVAGRRLRFRRALIATGSRAALPDVSGIGRVAYLTNETVFSLTEQPRRLAILGAGPVGCELAQAFARLGTQVLLVESAHGVLPREDRDAAAVVQRALEHDGVRVACCSRKLELQPAAGDRVRLTVQSHEQSYDEVVDRLLVATGRVPNVEGLHLEAAGVAYEARTGIVVDDRLRTTNRRIFAAGDVCSRYRFTHAADFLARLAVRNALFAGRAKASALTIPWCTYTSPELAHVGPTVAELEQRGEKVDTFTVPLEEVDRAVLDGQTEGFVRVHVKRGTDRVVAATVVAAHAGELIAELALAMTHGLRLKRLAATVHPYPTVSEAVRRVGDLYNRSRLTPLVRRLLRAWLAWTR